MQKGKAVVIARHGITTRLLIGLLQLHYEEVIYVEEKNESSMSVVKRRIRRIGFFRTVGQIMFRILIMPFISGRKRANELLKKSFIQPSDHAADIKVDDVNDDWDLSVLKGADTIYINGCSILKKKLIEQFDCPIINIHVGITPKYRGVHGGYWALYFRDKELFGTTLHQVDDGIDTGSIIEQSVISPTSKDTFKTYPTLQYIEGLRLLENNIEKIKSGEVPHQRAMTETSKLHFHPTFRQYLVKRILRGVK